MAQSDWQFGGTYTDTSGNRFRDIAYDYGKANGGGAATDNGGYGSLGGGQPNATISPIGGGALVTGGDYARAIVANSNGGTWAGLIDWAGMNLLKDSAVVGYPVTTTPPTTLVAQSVRGFMRIGCLAGSENNGTPGQSGVGSYVGLVAKGYTVGASDFNGNIVKEIVDGRYGYPYGYSAVLSSGTHYGLDPLTGGATTTGPGEVRLLILLSTDPNGSTAADYNYFECEGTYAYNTWYRVRMDVIPAAGLDTINVYTAPISDIVGSEVWTEVGTFAVTSGMDQYIPWDDTNANQVGWWWGGKSNVSPGQSLHDCYLDRWQFFWKDIS